MSINVEGLILLQRKCGNLLYHYMSYISCIGTLVLKFELNLLPHKLLDIKESIHVNVELKRNSARTFLHVDIYYLHKLTKIPSLKYF